MVPTIHSTHLLHPETHIMFSTCPTLNSNKIVIKGFYIIQS